MKRLLALVLGALGLTALLKRRREHASATSPAAPSPAEDLKATLAESRSAAGAEPPVEEPDVDARRADVHARAREAMDELSSFDS